jgi:hypothetical protein
MSIYFEKRLRKLEKTKTIKTILDKLIFARNQDVYEKTLTTNS